MVLAGSPSVLYQHAELHQGFRGRRVCAQWRPLHGRLRWCGALASSERASRGGSAGRGLGRTVSATIRGDLFAVFEQMAKYHPSEPHWYLPLIGVDPAHQGKGHGSALMTYALRQCDFDHSSAYLESTNPRNVSLYRRHGFEVPGTIQVGASPPLVPMLRKPR